MGGSELRRFFLALALLALCAAAHAAKVQVTWTNPDHNTDGTALTNLASVTIVWGACDASGGITQPYQAAEKVPTTTPGAAMSAFAYPTALSKACLAAYASTSTGLNSALSNVVEWKPPATLGQPNAIAGVIHLEFHRAKS